MLRLRTYLLATLVVAACGFAKLMGRDPVRGSQPPPLSANIELRESRSSASDLELGGELAGLRRGAMLYITLNDLLTLPQVGYVVSDDSNFAASTKISGVALSELQSELAADAAADLIVAICDDEYRANYTRSYVNAHQPLLVLKINGQLPSGWPKALDGHGYDMGPFLISHPDFVPSYRILSHPEIPQIPWGVVRLEFRNEKEVFGAIAPRGAHATDEQVLEGYGLAKQNCFRCHNMGEEGGQKAQVPWTTLGAMAVNSPEFFANYVRQPEKLNPQTKMEGSADYEDATMQALIAYFATFAATERR